MARQTTAFPQLSSQACDFCSHAVFVKAYACHSFVYLKGTPMEHDSGQQWTACAICSALIDRKKWTQLTERVVQAFLRQNHLPNAEVHVLREQMSYLHSVFRQHMIAES